MLTTGARPAPWYLTQRAHGLALMYLTRRDDLVIVESRADFGLDFLVKLGRNGSNSGRVFGVTIEAAVNENGTLLNGDAAHLELDSEQNPAWLDIPFPVVLLFFPVNGNQGYWGWVKEPVTSPDGRSGLSVQTDCELRKLTDATMDAMIATIDVWYDHQH